MHVLPGLFCKGKSPTQSEAGQRVHKNTRIQISLQTELPLATKHHTRASACGNRGWWKQV